MKPTLLGLPTSTMDGDGNMGAIVNGGTAYTNLINGQGDAIATANSSTNAISSYSFDAYGNKTSGSTTATPFSYRNQYSDSETGLYYLNARYYDPSAGSFTQEDTYWGSVKSPATLNLYGYCEGNPVTSSDPTGHYAQVRQGSDCSDVKTLQSDLNLLGYTGSNGKALTVDGDFGPNTDHAVRNFQSSHPECHGVDGIVGPNTWVALTNAVTVKQASTSNYVPDKIEPSSGGGSSGGNNTGNAGGSAGNGNGVVISAAPQLPNGVDKTIVNSGLTNKVPVQTDFYQGESYNKYTGFDQYSFSSPVSISKFLFWSNAQSWSSVYNAMTKTVAGWCQYLENTYGGFLAANNALNSICDFITSPVYDPEGYLTYPDIAANLYHYVSSMVKIPGYEYIAHQIEGYISRGNYSQSVSIVFSVDFYYVNNGKKSFMQTYNAFSW